MSKKAKHGRHPNSLKNLLPEPPMEARAKGGRAAAKANKKRRQLQEVVKFLMDLPMRDGDLDELQNLIQARNSNLTVSESLVLAQIRKALTGDTQAFKAIIDASGETREQSNPNDGVIQPSFRELLLGGEDEKD